MLLCVMTGNLVASCDPPASSSNEDHDCNHVVAKHGDQLLQGLAAVTTLGQTQVHPILSSQSGQHTS